MGPSIAPISSLLAGVAILLLGSGLQGTLLGVRAHIEAFPVEVTGLIMSVYFVGYIVGYYLSPAIVHRVGHIRAYAAFTSVASAVVLLYPLFVNPPVWFVLRLLSGICFAGIYMVVESWLNGATANANRGKILGIYMMVNLGALAAGQMFLMTYDPASAKLFLIASALVSIGLVPVALTRSPAPAITTPKPMPVRALYEASPLGIVGCFGSGLTLGAFWGIGPLYAAAIGISPTGVALFMCFTILGGMALQWPLGWFSDHTDRRHIIVAATFAIALIGVAFTLTSNRPFIWDLVLGILFGGFAFSLYSLCVAHANDFIPDEDKMAGTSGLLLAYGVGAAIGPVTAAAFMGPLGPDGMFVFVALASVIVGTFAVYRMRVRAAAPPEERAKFVPLPRTSPEVLTLDPRSEPAPVTAPEAGAAADRPTLP